MLIYFSSNNLTTKDKLIAIECFLNPLVMSPKENFTTTVVLEFYCNLDTGIVTSSGNLVFNKVFSKVYSY